MRLCDLTASITATGDWCTTCALPSVITIAFHRWTWDGAHLLGTVRRCVDCHPIQTSARHRQEDQ